MARIRIGAAMKNGTVGTVTPTSGSAVSTP